MNTSIQDEIKRCNREIAQIEKALLAGDPDVAVLCLALSDWSTEIRILNAELAGRQDAAEDKKSRRPEGQRLGTIGPLLPERVDPVPGVGLRTLDLETHLLAQGSAQEPPNRMSLPPGGFHELSRCSARHFLLLLPLLDHPIAKSFRSLLDSPVPSRYWLRFWERPVPTAEPLVNSDRILMNVPASQRDNL